MLYNQIQTREAHCILLLATHTGVGGGEGRKGGGETRGGGWGESGRRQRSDLTANITWHMMRGERRSDFTANITWHMMRGENQRGDSQLGWGVRWRWTLSTQAQQQQWPVLYSQFSYLHFRNTKLFLFFPFTCLFYWFSLIVQEIYYTVI